MPVLRTVTAPHERGEPLSVKLTVPAGTGLPVRAAVSVALVPMVRGPLVVVSVKPVGAAVPNRSNSSIARVRYR